jgi:HAE1 family hydrophobic/amphiphilic exporter-1
MRLATLSINRPIFITCLVILLLTVGYISLQKLPVDLFPDITFPVVLVNTTYPGASPEEVETLVSKVIEDEMNTISGIKTISSENTEGRSQVVAEFTSETDIKYAEQQVRDKLNAIKRKLPADIEDSSIKRIDPADKPILILSLKSPLPRAKVYELADKMINPKLEQINQVAMLEILGGSGREIHVDLDRNKLKAYELSVTSVANRIAMAGQNIPIGKIDLGKKEKVFRSLGEYQSIHDIGSVVMNFMGNDIPVTLNQIGTIRDSVRDEVSKSYVNGQMGLIMMIFRQTGTNTIKVVEKVEKKIAEINKELKNKRIPIEINVVRDGSKMIHDNVNDVMESILVGILLTVIVVYLFLGSLRSTFITGLALPTSLIGSFLLMHLASFSINTMSLLALSLAVGLLVDDAIVVRENIYRHNEKGKPPKVAAIEGTKEVTLAVIATSLTVVAVFGPIGFLHGIVGSFFKEFGLTVCFTMLISLLDALTIAPMLSAYLGLGNRSRHPNKLVQGFFQLQLSLEKCYAKILKLVLRFPISVMLSALFIFILSIFAVKYVPKTFVPAQDTGEFVISLELPPGTSLQAMDDVTKLIDKQIRSHHEVKTSVAIVGSRGQSNRTQFFINMIPSKERSINTTEFKRKIRKELTKFKNVKIVVKDVDLVGGGERPFNINITGDNLEELKIYAFKAYEKIKQNQGIIDPEISYKTGKPEVQIIPDLRKLQQLGVSSVTMGQELRSQVEGIVPAVYRENGQKYDIKVRLDKDQRDLEKNFNQTLIPNINNSLIKLADIATPHQGFSPSTITRKDRVRYIQISGDIAPNGPGMAGAMRDVKQLFETSLKLPPGISYSFQGQAESFTELAQNMTIALLLGVLFIYLVLASLYESFITPFTIMLVLPLAACGAFFSLLITRHSLDIFSMIGCILLFGIATKNSILLVDYASQLVKQGIQREEAIIQAGLTRLRPIIMTTIALIMGMLPIAIGLNEASKQRTSMGVAVIGGLISSTLLTLVVVPAAYSYIERFRFWVRRLLAKRSKVISTDPV